MPSTKSEKTADANSAQLSPTRENYLKFNYLEEREAGYARACNLAQLLGVTRSTVATTFRELKADSLIAYEPYSPMIAEEIVRRNAVIKRFFERTACAFPIHSEGMGGVKQARRASGDFV